MTQSWAWLKLTFDIEGEERLTCHACTHSFIHSTNLKCLLQSLQIRKNVLEARFKQAFHVLNIIPRMGREIALQTAKVIGR